MRTSTEVELLAQALGFVSAAALAWQAYRLVRHLRTIHDLREAAQRQSGRSADLQQRAERSAEALETLVARWDAVDYQLILVGLIGLMLSFLAKLASIVLW